MLTLHPTAKRDGDGYRPMVCIRKSNGKMFGSRTSGDHLWFLTAEAATFFATHAAKQVARAMPECVRVAA